jgi:hypothetical protein
MNKKCRSKDSNSLMNSEILSFPRFDLPFVLAVDSSSTGIGYILYQRTNCNPGKFISALVTGTINNTGNNTEKL